LQGQLIEQVQGIKSGMKCAAIHLYGVSYDNLQRVAALKLFLLAVFKQSNVGY